MCNAEVISGVSDLLEAEGYLVSVLDSQDDPVRQRRNLKAFISSSRAGLLWVPAQDTPEDTLGLLRTHRIPTVTFLRKRGFEEFDHVGIQNSAATHKATSYLADLGHRSIAYFGGVAEADVRKERIDGYRDAMEDRGLGPPVVWEASDDKLAGKNAMLTLRKAHPEVTAIVCNGDVVALGACHALRELGLTPGRDVSVIGFDDIQDASIATPPLTTLAVNPYELGRSLAKMLISRLKEPLAPKSATEMAATLIVRSTTGAPI